MQRLDHKQTAVALAGLMLCLSSALPFATLHLHGGATTLGSSGQRAATAGGLTALPRPAVLAVWLRRAGTDRQVAVLTPGTDGRIEAAMQALRAARPTEASAAAMPFTLVLYDDAGRIVDRITCSDDGRCRTGTAWLDGGSALAAWLKQWL